MRGEVFTQPCLLHGIVQDGLALTVDDDDVPGAKIVAVITKRRMRSGSEVCVVTSRSRRNILVIPQRGARAFLVSAPRRVITQRVLEWCARLVRVVARR